MNSMERLHKQAFCSCFGWLRVYASWIKNGLSVVLRGKAAYKEWSVVR